MLSFKIGPEVYLFIGDVFEMSTFKSDEEVLSLLENSSHGNGNDEKMGPIALIKHKAIGSGNHENHDRGDKKKGKQLRDTEDKADVAVLAEVVGNRAAGALLGVGETQVSQYKNGRNASNITDPELVDSTDKRLGILEETTIDKVDLFLSLIQDDKVAELSADKLASSADKMVNVLDKLRRRNEKKEERAKLPNIIIQGPAMVSMDQYATKEV